jgi:SAM-dependent methyltransferase
MLARRELPQEFDEWNRKWGAPYGHCAGRVIQSIRPGVPWRFPRLAGPFGLQANNQTRFVEYPWAFHAVPLRPGMTAVEIGGGLSGFQFVLARTGLHVINVDPGEGATGVGWRCDRASIDRLNRAFRTRVALENCTLEAAALPAASADLVFSISAIEHIPERELPSLMVEVARILKPGGSVVMTVDLFLDLAPFSDRVENVWGWNVDLRALVESSGLDLTFGDESELNGYPSFSARAILAKLSELYYGDYPACSQLLVLGKRE